jgi:hypothetical protein
VTLRIEELPAGWIQCPTTAELGGPAARSRWSEELSRGLMQQWATLGPAERSAVAASFELGVREADEGASLVLQRRVPDTIAHLQLSLRELVVEDGADLREVQLVDPADAMVGQPIVERARAALLGDGIELRGVARFGQPGAPAGAAVDVAVYRALFAGPGRLVTVSMNPIPVRAIGRAFADAAELLDLVRLVDSEGETPDLDIDRRVAEAVRTRPWGRDAIGDAA